MNHAFRHGRIRYWLASTYWRLHYSQSDSHSVPTWDCVINIYEPMFWRSIIPESGISNENQLCVALASLRSRWLHPLSISTCSIQEWWSSRNSWMLVYWCLVFHSNGKQGIGEFVEIWYVAKYNGGFYLPYIYSFSD